MAYVPTLKKMYKEQVVPALVKQFDTESEDRAPGTQTVAVQPTGTCTVISKRPFSLRHSIEASP